MNHLSDTLRDLMDRQKMTGAKLAESIGLSATSVSRILTGYSKPRQVTLSRMMKYLCQNADDEQALLAAYESLSIEKLPASPVLDNEENAQIEEERVRRFLEIKAQSIAFKASVAREMDKLGVSYRPDYTQGAVVTDFLVETEDGQVAVECKFNVGRDLEKAVVSARIIKESFGCEGVLIIVPCMDTSVPAETTESDIHFVPVTELKGGGFLTSK